MPSYSAIELENLVQPRVRDSYKKPLNVSPPRQARDAAPAVQPPSSGRHVYISPSLYATPEPAPIPDTVTDPMSPSPYVVNHKRRGWGSGVFGNRKADSDGLEEKEKDKPEGAGLVEGEKEAAVAVASRDVVEDNFSGGAAEELSVHKGEAAADKEEEFLDSRFDSMSIGSENGSSRRFDSRSFVSTPGEFFDAIEDFNSDFGISTTSVNGQNLESELRSLRLSLLEEIERRKEAEDALNAMSRKWQEISDLLSEVGIKLPKILISSGGIQSEEASMEDFSQALIVHRYVTHAVGKAEARAEVELAAEAILKSKDQEISRLRDRLKYYEAVNHEMTQRNQEIKEVSRKQRRIRQKRWFWSTVGALAAIGISALAYAYTSSSHHSSPSTSHSDTSSCQAE
ncbi:OLC1v1038764C1 [Oldenlandia corymbosa var. corymbosa]|uniref:OLC1v1038764C1 n=1 Tax=Oldenlandia corymbosa var. corymbosa TaxID=529605 RepID=A0AAV1D0I7_OLDCO|nr:OLC1v1038764C1 [Oldenlandia corymbosa var. corymbosa]